MIIAGTLAKIHPDFPLGLLPVSTGILTSVSFTEPQRPVTPIQTVRTNRLVGVYKVVYRPFGVSFNYNVGYDTGMEYMDKAIRALRRVSGKVFRGPLPSQSERRFYPISIASASFSARGMEPPTYTISFQFFHLNESPESAIPITSDIVNVVDEEVEINLDRDSNEPIDSINISVSGQYQLRKVLDGYAGVKYANVNLSQAVSYFDSEFAPTFPFQSYYRAGTFGDQVNSSINVDGKLVYTRTLQGVIQSEDDLIDIPTLPDFTGASL